MPVLNFDSISGLFLGLMLGSVLICSSAPAGQTAAVGHSDNVYWGVPVLPATLKRVLVLPLACEAHSGDLSDGCAALNLLPATELMRAQKFEVVPADPGIVRRLTGRMTWNGTEVLPADFFVTLQRVYGCDAVLFCELTAYRAYPPMESGWRMKLVEAPSRQILWAVDDVFTAPQPEPLDDVESFHLPKLSFLSGTADQWKLERSPRLFCQYSLASVFSSLPYRQEIAKVSRRSADVRIGRWSKDRH